MEIEIETATERLLHAVRPGQTCIGRAPENDITVIDDCISKRHLLLWCDNPGSVRVRDLGSKNGTTLNGKALVGEGELQLGDELVLGGSVHIRLTGIEDGFLATVTPGSMPEASDDDMGTIARVLHQRAEALRWAMNRAGNIAAAPSQLARYRYLVAEARRQLAPVTSSVVPTVWVLSWEQPEGQATPTFSSLVHDHDVVDVPSPSQFASSIVGQTVAARKPIWVDDARADQRTNTADSVFSLRLRSVGCLPVGRNAVLYVSDPRDRSAFSVATKLRIEALCSLAGRLEAVDETPTDQTWSQEELLPGIVGTSQPMQDVARKARAFARFTWNVLILGDPGTGKSAVARAIHEISGRDGPFVHVNCATLTDTLAASELFGSVKGAYNDARDRPGYVGSADGGTLFLDEVGELPLELQATLLVLTRERTYHRVGQEEVSRPFSGRLLAATNRSLSALRPDLAERLSECVVEMPPLRTRRGDVPELAELFLRQLCEAEAEATGGRTLTLSRGALDLLASGDLDGDVARLKNRVQQGFMWAVVEGSDEVRVEHLAKDAARSSERAGTSAAPQTFDAAVTHFTRRLLVDALERNQGNKTRTAEELGMTNRQQLLRHLKKVGLLDNGDGGSD